MDNEPKQEILNKLIKNLNIETTNKKNEFYVTKKIIKWYPYSQNKIKRRLLSQKNKPFYLNKNSFKLLKILLLIFKQKIYTWKQNFFFIFLLRRLILKITTTFENFHTIKIFKILNLLSIKESSFRYQNTFFQKKIFKLRYFFFQNASSILSNGIFAIDNSEKTFFSFSSIHTHHLTANQICNYIIIKLGQYFKLFEILQPILRSLRRAQNISGFRLLIVGRLTRRERAAHLIRKHGRLSLANQSLHIDLLLIQKLCVLGLSASKFGFIKRL